MIITIGGGGGNISVGSGSSMVVVVVAVVDRWRTLVSTVTKLWVP